MILFPTSAFKAIPCLQEYTTSAAEADPVHGKDIQPVLVQFHLGILEELLPGTHLSVHC